MKLIFITGNKGKFDEASKIITDLEQKDIDLTEIQSLDPKVIIRAKLEEAKKQVGGNIIVEDGSLCIDAIKGLPGPMAKWFLKILGNNGFYKMVKNYEDKRATINVILGVSFENETTQFFEGSISGVIVAPRGENGFGWDKIFMPNGFDKTFAEMTPEEKNEISMRKVAFQKLKDYLINK